MNSLLLTAVLWCGGPASQPVITEAHPFRHVELTPADVTLYVRVIDAAGLRHDLADRPIAKWIGMVIGKGKVAEAWQGLARSSGVEEGALFDLVLGQEVTFLQRGIAGHGEWLVLTAVKPAAAERILNRLKPRVLPPRHGAVMLELPEHQLLIARHANAFLIAPAAQPALMNDVLWRLATPAKQPTDRPADAAMPALKAARELGDGRIGVLVRHDPPMGGWSAAVASLHGDRVVIRQRSEFDNVPFTRDMTRIEIDTAPLQAFEHHALAAIIEPTDIGGGRLETYIVTRLGENLISPQMRRNLGHRCILVLGEIEGRQEPEPIDLQAPTIAVCFELRDPSEAPRHLDTHMMNLGRRIKSMGEGTFDLELPELTSDRKVVRRQIDLSPAGEWLTGGLPLVRPVSLNWSVADGPLGQYYVIATHPAELKETLAVLNDADRAPIPPRVGRVHGCGTANGVRIGHHLRSWGDRAELFADDSQQDAFRETLHLMSELAGGLGRVRWQLTRPSVRTLELDVSIELTPPESARSE